MSSDDRIRKTNGPFRTTMLLLNGAILLFIIGFGVWLLISPDALPRLESQYKNIFGVTSVVYGLYRSWRVYTDYF